MSPRLSSSQLKVLEEASFGPLRRVVGGWVGARRNFIAERQARVLLNTNYLALIRRGAFGPGLVLTKLGRETLDQQRKAS